VRAVWNVAKQGGNGTNRQTKRSELKSRMRMLNVNEEIVWLSHVVHVDDCSRWAGVLYRV
jgi:hypothetical protein